MNSQTPGKILIADDNPDNLRVISEQLGDSNYEIRVARDGFGALESIQADTPDLILLDILMPRMDGYELCCRLKKDERYKDIPIIFISALDESFNKVKGFQSGAVDYILKPFEAEEVKARVKTNIEHYMYQKELKDLHQELERRIEERTNEFRESEAKLRGFIDGSEDAICIRDKDRRIVIWNEAFARGIKDNCGIDVQVGMRAEDYVPEEIFAQFEEQRKRLYPAIEGKPTHAEYPFPGKDGETHYFDVRWTPVHLDGKVFGVAEVSRDITDQKLANIKLIESNERFSAYMQNSTEAIWCFDLKEPVDISLPVEKQLDLVYKHAYLSECNDAYAKLASLERKEELIGITLAEVMPRDKPENVTELIELIQNQYTTTGFESIERYPSGEERILLNNSVGIIKDGFMYRAWGTAIDITKIKTAEKKLKEAEQRYRTVADFTYDWEYWESADGKMLYVSPSCERISGFPAKAFVENADLIQEIIVKEDRDIWDDHRHKARSKSNLSEVEFRIHTKDGVTRWIEHACQSVQGANGEFLGIRASNRDITTRKLAENELKRKDQMLEDAQRIAHLGSWDWDIMTNRLEWTDEVFRIFGLSSQNFGATYEDFLERIHPDDREDVKKAVNRALSDVSFNYNIAHRIRRPDGSERIVRERGNVSFDDNTGKASHMIGTVQDITDIKKMETDAERLRTELSRLDRASMMGVLSAGIAHEINQPLAAILSNAQAAIRFMKKDPQDIEEVKAALLDIISDDKRAGEIVHSIRSIIGRDDLKREEMDLNETVREVLTLVKSEAVNRGVSISVNLQPDIPPVYGDRIQMQQVTLNLVMNGLEVLKRHHISAPEVTVSTQVEDNKDVILSVSDSGPGIEPDQLNTIFDSYETTKKGGLGIGLAICRSIADKHCGQLWAENRPEGGATFFFRLPPLVA